MYVFIYYISSSFLYFVISFVRYFCMCSFIRSRFLSVGSPLVRSCVISFFMYSFRELCLSFVRYFLLCVCSSLFLIFFSAFVLSLVYWSCYVVLSIVSSLVHYEFRYVVLHVFL